jgi:hypothetical protein
MLTQVKSLWLGQAAGLSALVGLLTTPAVALASNDVGGSPAGESPAAPVTRPSLGDMVRRIGMAGIEDQLAGRLIEISGRLKLSPDQESIMKQVFDAESAELMTALDRLLSRQATAGDFDRLARFQRGELPGDFGVTLNEEQRALFTSLQAERRDRSVEDRVIAELSGLAAAGGLAPEQHARASTSLKEIIQSEDATAVHAMASLDELRAYFDRATQRRLDALQPILTSQQLQLYRRQVEVARQVLGSLLPDHSP